MTADEWSALAAWVALALTIGGNAWNWWRSRNAGLKARDADLRSEEALGVAKLALEQLQTFNDANAARDKLADHDREATARAKWFMQQALSKGTEQAKRWKQLTTSKTVSFGFEVKTEADRLGLLKAAEQDGCRIDSKEVKVGGRATLHVPNPKYTGRPPGL